MAEKEDIRERVRNLNPLALEVMDLVDQLVIRYGDSKGVTVTMTEDMTPEEQEMALFEGFLKEGYSVEVAIGKAKEWLILMKQTTELFQKQRADKGK